MSPRKNGKLDFEGMIANGENPNGMMAQTADGTLRNADALGPQDWHWNQSADGPRWNDGFQPKPDVPAQPTLRRKRR